MKLLRKWKASTNLCPFLSICLFRVQLNKQIVILCIFNKFYFVAMVVVYHCICFELSIIIITENIMIVYLDKIKL